MDGIEADWSILKCFEIFWTELSLCKDDGKNEIQDLPGLDLHFFGHPVLYIFQVRSQKCKLHLGRPWKA